MFEKHTILIIYDPCRSPPSVIPKMFRHSDPRYSTLQKEYHPINKNKEHWITICLSFRGLLNAVQATHHETFELHFFPPWTRRVCTSHVSLDMLNPTMTCCSHSMITWQFLADVNHTSFAKSMELIMVPTYNLMLCPDVSHPRVKSRVRRS